MIAISSDGCRLQWIEHGSGPAILLIHGFASNLDRNWRATGWLDAIAKAGWRAIAYDQRGHGASDKRYDPGDYAPARLIADACAVLDAAGCERAVVMGYSMGASVALQLTLAHPGRVRALVLAGMGARFFRAFGAAERDLEIVARALEADDPANVPPAGLAQRRFAEQSHGDLKALAACWRRPRRSIEPSELAAISVPTLVMVGERDELAGDGAPLADAIPGAKLVVLAGKDHAKAVGAKDARTAVRSFIDALAAVRPA